MSNIRLKRLLLQRRKLIKLIYSFFYWREINYLTSVNRLKAQGNTFVNYISISKHSPTRRQDKISVKYAIKTQDLEYLLAFHLLVFDYFIVIEIARNKICPRVNIPTQYLYYLIQLHLRDTDFILEPYSRLVRQLYVQAVLSIGYKFDPERKTESKNKLIRSRWFNLLIARTKRINGKIKRPEYYFVHNCDHTRFYYKRLFRKYFAIPYNRRKLNRTLLENDSIAIYRRNVWKIQWEYHCIVN